MFCVSDDMSDAERPYDGWHLKKEIQLGHVLTTIALAVAMYGYIATMERRITLLESHAASQAAVDNRQDIENRRVYEALLAHLTRLEDKLDRLIESGRK
jgi:uncharacterized coiled-coil protein SlyX